MLKLCKVFSVLFVSEFSPIQHNVVQSIELQQNKGASKSQENSSCTGIAKFAGVFPIITVPVTAITGVAPAKVGSLQS